MFFVNNIIYFTTCTCSALRIFSVHARVVLSNSQIETKVKYMEVKLGCNRIIRASKINYYNDSIAFALSLVVKYCPELLKTKAAATLLQRLEAS